MKKKRRKSKVKPKREKEIRDKKKKITEAKLNGRCERKIKSGKLVNTKVDERGTFDELRFEE